MHYGKKVVSLGEILLRLSPPQYQTLSQTSRLDCQFGGSELNVLATLAQLGHQVELISVIPDNDLGSITQQFLFSKQIGQNNVLRKGDRLGLYYYQKGFLFEQVQSHMIASTQYFGKVV